MTRSRSFVCLLMSGILLLANLHTWRTPGCSMCGSSCHCASRAAGDSCSVRAGGCGGGAGGDAIGAVNPLRAVLVAAVELAPCTDCARVSPDAAHLPPQLARPPVDRPPRISC